MYCSGARSLSLINSKVPFLNTVPLPLSYHIIPILLRITFINRLKEGKA